MDPYGIYHRYFEIKTLSTFMESVGELGEEAIHVREREEKGGGPRLKNTFPPPFEYYDP